jgi:hypothetical protein
MLAAAASSGGLADVSASLAAAGVTAGLLASVRRGAVGALGVFAFLALQGAAASTGAAVLAHGHLSTTSTTLAAVATTEGVLALLASSTSYLQLVLPSRWSLPPDFDAVSAEKILGLERWVSSLVEGPCRVRLQASSLNRDLRKQSRVGVAAEVLGPVGGVCVIRAVAFGKTWQMVKMAKGVAATTLVVTVRCEETTNGCVPAFDVSGARQVPEGPVTLGVLVEDTRHGGALTLHFHVVATVDASHGPSFSVGTPEVVPAKAQADFSWKSSDKTLYVSLGSATWTCASDLAELPDPGASVAMLRESVERGWLSNVHEVPQLPAGKEAVEPPAASEG